MKIKGQDQCYCNVTHLAIAAQLPDPLGEERKGAICQEGKTEKSVGTERPAGGKATNGGTVPKVRGQVTSSSN